MTVISENQAIWVKRQIFHALFFFFFFQVLAALCFGFSHFRDHNSFTSFIGAQWLSLRKTLSKCRMLLVSHCFCNEHVSDSCWLQKAPSEFGFRGCSEGRDSQPAARYHRAASPRRRGGSEIFQFLCTLIPYNTRQGSQEPTSPAVIP